MSKSLVEENIEISDEDLLSHFEMKYGKRSISKMGWGPKLRFDFWYFTPDDFYEVILNKLVKDTTRWLDVGCGRNIFSENQALENCLKKRSQFIAGVDPSNNIDDNYTVDKRYKCTIEDVATDEKFSLITTKMVVEHVANPSKFSESLARLTENNGVVVIYTVNQWSPSSFIASITPMRFHNFVKKILWGGNERDTFPTKYKMNTRKKIQYYMGNAGFREERFFKIGDCRSLQRWRWTNYVELIVWRSLKNININYPDLCFIGIYRRK